MPKRQLHLKHPEGFDDDMFARFEAGCRIWTAYVHAVLAEDLHNLGTVEYIVMPPTLSADRTVATLSISGAWTIGARAHFEDGASFMLREFLPIHFVINAHEGLTEDRGDGPQTSWRKALKPQ